MPDGLGSAAARIAEKAGCMRPVLEFFRDSPRLLRRYAADDGARDGRQLERTMENVRRVIDRYGITMNRGAEIRIDKGIRGVRGVTMPGRMIRLSPQAFRSTKSNWRGPSTTRTGTSVRSTRTAGTSKTRPRPTDGSRRPGTPNGAGGRATR